MIKISNVSKTYEKVQGLKNVTLEIGEGTVCGLIGSNGSGKSTLMKILTGIYLPDSGDVTYDGEKVYENPKVKKDILYLSDDQYFIPHATIKEMKNFYKSVYTNFSEKRYTKLIALFNLDENRRVQTLSKGMQKQASIAIAFSCMPKYLFCDETFDGLDPVVRGTVRKLLAEDVVDRNMCAVMASHNLRELEDICDHICLLHKGSLVLDKGLDDAKCSTHRIQVSFNKDDVKLAANMIAQLNPISMDLRGSSFTVLINGDENELDEKIRKMNPVFMEFVPLTLEEIFIAEMEAKGYAYN